MGRAGLDGPGPFKARFPFCKAQTLHRPKQQYGPYSHVYCSEALTSTLSVHEVQVKEGIREEEDNQRDGILDGLQHHKPSSCKLHTSNLIQELTINLHFICRSLQSFLHETKNVQLRYQLMIPVILLRKLFSMYFFAGFLHFIITTDKNNSVHWENSASLHLLFIVVLCFYDFISPGLGIKVCFSIPLNFHKQQQQQLIRTAKLVIQLDQENLQQPNDF